MTEDFGRYEDAPRKGRRSAVAGAGALLLMAAVGVGIGLLAAPETGVKTRRRLGRRLRTLGSELGEGLEGVQEFGGRARDRMREQLEALRRRNKQLEAQLEEDEDEEEDEEDEESRTLGTILAVAAGAAATYLLASERAAPARSRVRETADTVRRKATDRWERYQQSRGSNGETAGPVPTSDEPPLGS